MKHPFALNDSALEKVELVEISAKEIAQVSGAQFVEAPTHECSEEGGSTIKPPIYSTDAVGEEGGGDIC